MAAGSIRVDFAGTILEAREFAAKNNVNLPRSMYQSGAERMPQLSLPFLNIEQQQAASRRFTELGWEPDFQMVRYRADHGD